MAQLFAAIEGGGSKFIVSVGRGLELESARTRIPTTSPDETIAAILAFLAPRLGDDAGLGGAYALAADALVLG